MVNEAIRIGLQENLTSQFSITRKCYPLFTTLSYHTSYRLAAVNIATGILKNYRRELRKNPKVKKPYLKYSLFKTWKVKVKQDKLRLSLQPFKFIYIPLNNHTLSVLSNFTVRAVTLTDSIMSIAYSKEIVEIKPTGLIGIDRNLDNVTTSNLNGELSVFDLSRATKIKTRYREVQSHFKRNDDRIRKRICGKYGFKQRNRVKNILHKTSKTIINQAKESNSGIVMENIKGIRKLYQKGNGQGSFYRSRLNSWSYFELQRQIEYKARWEGIPVIYVKAAKTSSKCAICGSPITECTQRKVYCHKCDKLMDRDENAALNIVKQGYLEKPCGLASEAMVQEPLTGNLESQCKPMEPLQVRVFHL